MSDSTNTPTASLAATGEALAQSLEQTGVAVASSLVTEAGSAAVDALTGSTLPPATTPSPFISLSLPQATKAVMASIQTSVTFFLNQTTKNAQHAEAAFTQLLANLQPQISDALSRSASGDPEAAIDLDHLYGQIKAQTALSVLDLLEQEQTQVTNLITSAIQTGIQFATAALVTASSAA